MKKKQADFCIYDGEGVTGEAYFVKIIKSKGKLKNLKIVGCFQTFYESCVRKNEILQDYIDGCIEKCNENKEYPMKFIREKEHKELINRLVRQSNMPMAYLHDGNKLFIGDEETLIRYPIEEIIDDFPKAFWNLAKVIALELMTHSGEIDELDVLIDYEL